MVSITLSRKAGNCAGSAGAGRVAATTTNGSPSRSPNKFPRACMSAASPGPDSRTFRRKSVRLDCTARCPSRCTASLTPINPARWLMFNRSSGVKSASDKTPICPMSRSPATSGRSMNRRPSIRCGAGAADPVPARQGPLAKKASSSRRAAPLTPWLRDVWRPRTQSTTSLWRILAIVSHKVCSSEADPTATVSSAAA